MAQEFLQEEYAIIKKPIDHKTGKPYETCRYALYPGISLSASEPELVVKLYDSLLQQRADTGMLLYQGYGSDPLLTRKYQQRLLVRWRSLGKPTVILATPEDRRFFRANAGEIPTVSLYDELLAFNVSGGCNSELYRLNEPDQYGSGPALRKLSEMMGVVLADEAVASMSEAKILSSEDISKVPFLTSSIDLRNDLKRKGRDAVHILELIYGMGDSNLHLAHEHGAGHDHSKAPEVRESPMSAEELAAQARLFDETARRQNLKELHDVLISFFWPSDLK